eukprot:jgi/Hompol1/2714/HPOL_006139-RA
MSAASALTQMRQEFPPPDPYSQPHYAPPHWYPHTQRPQMQTQTQMQDAPWFHPHQHTGQQYQKHQRPPLHPSYPASTYSADPQAIPITTQSVMSMSAPLPPAPLQSAVSQPQIHQPHQSHQSHRASQIPSVPVSSAVAPTAYDYYRPYPPTAPPHTVHSQIHPQQIHPQHAHLHPHSHPHPQMQMQMQSAHASPHPLHLQRHMHSLPVPIHAPTTISQSLPQSTLAQLPPTYYSVPPPHGPYPHAVQVPLYPSVAGAIPSQTHPPIPAPLSIAPPHPSTAWNPAYGPISPGLMPHGPLPATTVAQPHAAESRPAATPADERRSVSRSPKDTFPTGQTSTPASKRSEAANGTSDTNTHSSTATSSAASAAAAAAASKKGRASKDPTAPKHPTSAFLFYLSDVRPQYTAKYPGSTVGPISKLIAAAWKELPPEEKLEYLQKAEVDKERYRSQMEAWITQKTSRRMMERAAAGLVPPVLE